MYICMFLVHVLTTSYKIFLQYNGMSPFTGIIYWISMLDSNTNNYIGTTICYTYKLKWYIKFICWKDNCSYALRLIVTCLLTATAET